MMKTIISLIAVAAVIALYTAPAAAGCGKKVATVGELESYDASSMTLTIKVTQTSHKSQKGQSVELKLTSSTRTMGGKDIEDLVGSSLSIISEHGKADFVVPLLSS